MDALTDAALNARTNEEKLAYLALAKRSSKNQSLHFDCAHNQLEHFVIKFADDLCRQSTLPIASLAPAVEALALLLSSSSKIASSSIPTTQRWAICVAARIWRPMLFALANASPTNADVVQFKANLWQIKEWILSNLAAMMAAPGGGEEEREDMQRVYYLRFVEVVALSLLRSDLDQSTAKRTSKSSSSNAGAGATKLVQFESLRDCPNAHALLNAIELSNEGLACVDLLIANLPSTQAINSLSLVARYRPDSRDRALRALAKLDTATQQQLLKPNLFLLLKAVVPNKDALENNAQKDAIVTLLQNKCVMGEEHLLRYLKPLEEEWARFLQKREELKRKLALYPEGRSNQFPTEGLAHLPVHVICNFLLANIVNLPEPPPEHRPKQQKLQLGQSSGLPLALDRLMQQVKAVEMGKASLNLPPAVRDCGAIHVPPDQALKLRESTFTRLVQSSISTTKTSFTAQFQEQICIARLACDATDDALKHLLLQELKQNAFRDEEEMALVTALHVEFATGNATRYLESLLAILDGLMETNQTQRLERVIVQVPALPEPAFDRLLERCNDANHFLDYFAVLRALVLARPSAREVGVWFLLQSHAVKPGQPMQQQRTDSRTAAVNLIANRLVKGMGPKWQQRISSFALDTLRSITAEDVALEQEGENAVLAKVQLFVALCATNPVELVPQLFAAYAALREELEADSPAFACLEQECDKLWQRLSGEFPALHALSTFLQRTPAHSTDLLYRAVQTFCEKSNQASLAVMSVLGLVHEGEEEEPIVVRDSRFLVPIVGCLSMEEILVALGRICNDCDQALIERAVDNIVAERKLDFTELFLSLARNEIETDHMMGLLQACDALMDKLDETAARKVVVKLLEMMEEEEELPSLLMDYCIRAMKRFRGAITPLALQMLHRAVRREIWAMQDEVLWEGFERLCLLCRPQSFELILGGGLPDKVFLDFAKRNEAIVENFKEMLKRAAVALLAEKRPDNKPAFTISAAVRQYLGL